MNEEDEIITKIPIRLSNRLSLQIHQFPLLSRPLQAPPSAEASGKRITARIKPQSRVLEIHVPVDTRPEVYNTERGHELGKGQLDDDREQNQERKGKGREGEEPRLAEVRLRSEEIPQRGVQMLGIVHENELHLHPISAIHQFRPTLTYLDIISRKSRRRGGDDSDSDSDDGPPPDPDEPAPTAAPPKKEKKTAAGEAKEVQVSARRIDDKAGNISQLSNARKEMLAIIRAEQEESWQNLEFCGMTTEEAGHSLDQFFSYNNEELHCSTDVTTFLTTAPKT
ncbi:DNA-directed RNA polymerase III subunit Rpc5 [Lentinula aff. detonsa]|uniref:DNA-directed RNA polymerase III subunit Rpc5 n=1 Tax=Lentinula aff. detonsa TaxID=2804958 RepID=A0AA38NE95_9AGAR|nr:DNA-directed RNA polymerase III subunit Rpc5 [Lentinula aff. detonsa]KAJ3798811.1 DNA-directed RNA polymerase III subunit Rpc5 [Lentinula aff. detonsa]